MEVVRWGVIGAGGIADRRTLPVIGSTRNCALVIVMDVRDPDHLARKYGVDATDRIEDVLSRSDVDAVYIASPVQFHAEQAVAAARAGKHVLCEKPLARSLAEAQEIVVACREAGVLLREAYMLRHHGAHQQMARLLSEGAIGKPVFARVEWAFLYPRQAGAWRQVPELGGGGVLADIGCHVFDLLTMFLGPIARVAASCRTLVQDYPVEDMATVLVEFESGAQGAVATSFCISADAMPASVSIFGSAGALVASHTLSQESGGSVVLRPNSSPPRELSYEKVDMYARQLEAFADDVAAGQVVRPGSEADLLRSMRTLDAAYKSCRSHRFVAV